MRTAAILLGVVAAAAWGWLAAAAAILCKLAGQMGLFAFPYLQWPHLAHTWWRVNWYSTVLVVVSAAVPTLLLLVLCVAAALFFCAGARARWRHHLMGSNLSSRV